MAGDAEQTDSSGKYTFGGGAAAAKKYWPTILKSIELVCYIFSKWNWNDSYSILATLNRFAC